ncbi:hypothetical protein [Burkholderia sp. BCC1993]|uniref:hypothetical protein n=1 Tax=Burkholderia sp. BCC1993 TaxID=2817444 RepID=UPI002AB2CBB8|nr:hypothetical protein [Burkholderia sp. BCC1993]
MSNLPFRTDAAGLLNFLWDQFDTKNATNEELERLACASEDAAEAAEALSQNVAGIGCLINEDRCGNEVPSGALQDDHQTSLLFVIANQIELIGKMAKIGSDAEHALRKRMAAQLEKSASRCMRSAEHSSPAMEGA